MVKVFISYAHEDEESARRFYRELKNIDGIDPWLDKECLQPGMRWRPAIRKAIRDADFFIALLSSRSGSRRGFVNTELNQALEIFQEFPDGQIFIIPVRLDSCEMQHYELQAIQYVDFFPNWDSGMVRVLKSINSRMSVGFKEKEVQDKKSDTNLNEPLEEKPSFDYEYRIGIVDLDLGVDNLSQIAKHLNSIQHYFWFTPTKIHPLSDVVQSIGDYPNFVLNLVPESFYAKRQYLGVDLVACITKHPIAFNNSGRLFYNYFSSPSDQDERFMFLSLSQLDIYTKDAGVTFEKGIVHLISAELVEYFAQLGSHSTTRGCLMDFCQTRSDIVLGLKERKLCSWCARKIHNKAFKQAVEALLKSDVRV